ncbi:Flp family type IVb pilin [Pseudomonas asiatica]|uniref:Flp family type IVb pilin n=1 Tax=Pseudomonas asiatica TaxID=2219225 RepID=UPI00383ADB36
MTLQTIKASVMKFVKDEDGLTIVEYAVAGGLVTLAVAASFDTLATAITTALGRLSTCMAGGAC